MLTTFKKRGNETNSGKANIAGGKIITTFSYNRIEILKRKKKRPCDDWAPRWWEKKKREREREREREIGLKDENKSLCE